MDNYLISISGPTAIGKTTLSINLAKELNTEIISFDSRQFYKEMSIGTAVPNKLELDEVKHHFIQHKSIHHRYNISTFSSDAKKKIKELFIKNKNIILVGGSYMYLKSIIYGIDDIPKAPAEIRDELNTNYNIFGIEHLQNQLKLLDPEYYQKVDLSNHRRLIRALEVCLHTKKPFSSFLKRPNKKNYNHISISLKMEREKLYERINNRVDTMLKNGLIEEVKTLYSHRELNTLNTIGYKELFKYFGGFCTKDKAIDEIKKNTRRFAKKQITWLNNNDDHYWIDPEISINKLKDKLNQVIG